ncbi:MAG: glycosyltransferase family 4 protein [Verrucomicrobiota bacterium]
MLTNLYPPHYLGGYELICQAVVNALRSRGHSVFILTSNHTIDTARGLPETFGIERSLRLHGFYGHPWLGIRKLAALEAWNNRRLLRVLEEVRPDLVYVWNMGGLSKSMLLTLQHRGLPTVYYLSDHWIARGLPADVWLRWWNRSDAPARHRLVRQAASLLGMRRRWQKVAPTNPPGHIRFQRIYFCSRALRQAAVAAGFAVSHAAIIYCPVDVQKFFGEPKPSSQPVRRLLFVGRLAADKGVMTALRAMACLGETEKLHLNLYGRGEPGYENQLRSFAMAHRLRVEFHCTTQAEMPRIYREHDVLIFPSEWEEPFALTPLEAMACGLPVVATTTGGSAELFRHEENALTFKAGDFEELAHRIRQMVSQHSLRARVASTGFCEVRQRFSEPVIVDQIEHYLRETLLTWKPAPLPPLNA